jgi:hypothetical protein
VLAPLLVLLVQAAPALQQSGEVRRYSIDAQIDPVSGVVQVTAEMELLVPEGGLSSFEFFLNEGFEVTDVYSEAAILSISRHDERLGSFQFAPAGVPIEVAFAGSPEPGRILPVVVTYGGAIVGDPWGTNRVTEDWIELGMYSAWFPLKPDDRSFTSRVTVTLDSSYTVTGAGQVTQGSLGRNGRQWTLEQSSPSGDIVVIAGPELRRRPTGADGAGMVIYESRFTPTRVEQIVSDVSHMVRSAGAWFGEPEPTALTLVFADRERGGGYTRPGLVVVSYDGNPETYPRFAKGLAHEVSHFWWSRAPTTTWQDWLNESFAEYSALMWVRTRMGEDVFSEYLSRYTEQAADLPPIRDIARDHEEAYAVLYRKGPVVLSRLEGVMGRDAFLVFLRAVNEDDVQSTDRLLELVEELASPEARENLANGLVG